MWPGDFCCTIKYGYVADAQTEERSALRLVLLDLNIQVVGQAADWMASNDPLSASSTRQGHAQQGHWDTR
jgi:hypothetical protein